MQPFDNCSYKTRMAHHHISLSILCILIDSLMLNAIKMKFYKNFNEDITSIGKSSKKDTSELLNI